MSPSMSAAPGSAAGAVGDGEVLGAGEDDAPEAAEAEE